MAGAVVWRGRGVGDRETFAVTRNVDAKVVAGFGDEWSRFDQSALADVEAQSLFHEYFDIFPWADLPPNAIGFDAGCGSGRWARLVAPRAGRLYCFDASDAAVAVATRNLASHTNCEVAVATVDVMPIADGSADFGYSLGVLHHIPDTAAALRDCVRKLRSGAPFLVYLYYRFDNRPAWYRALWSLTNGMRWVLSRSPHPVRYAISQLLAATIYWPLSRLARLAEKAGISPHSWPLAYYRHRSYYVLRTDALDRFGTRLEQRFTREEIEAMMCDAGLENVIFSPHAPFWCAVGWKS
jgi:SAM-dependent methyltransferase